MNKPQKQRRGIKGLSICPSFSIDEHKPVVEIALVNEDLSEEVVDYWDKEDAQCFVNKVMEMLYQAECDTLLINFLSDWGFPQNTIAQMMEDFKKWRIVSDNSKVKTQSAQPN